MKFPRQLWCWAGLIAALAILTVAWFSSLPHPVFMGDDLNHIMSAQTGGYASSLEKALTYPGEIPKYRPVFAFYLYLETLMFGSNFISYIYLNIFLEFISACLIALICYRLSRKQLLLALMGGVMFLISRLSYYHVHQIVGGALEGTALALFLLMVYTVVRAYQSRRLAALAWPLLFYFLLIFTHERYVVAGAFLTAAILMAPVHCKQHWHRYAIATIPALTLLFNYQVKTYIVHVPFFWGTETALTFEPLPIWNFMLAGLANMFGFNAGPDMFSGLDIVNAGFTGYVLGGLFAIALVALLAAYVYQRFKAKQNITSTDARDVFLFLVLFIPLLVAASVVTRQEYRWLYAPYVVVIFAVAYLFGRISATKWLRLLLLASILLSAIAVDTFYRGYLHNVFFYNGQKIADSAKRNIVDKYGSVLAQKDLFIVGADDTTRLYVLRESNFIKYYSGDDKLGVSYFDDVDKLKDYQGNPDNLLVFWLDPENREIIDITDQARDALLEGK